MAKSFCSKNFPSKAFLAKKFCILLLLYSIFYCLLTWSYPWIFGKSLLSDGDHDRKLEKLHKIAVMGKLDKFLIRSVAAQEITTRKNTITMYGTDDRERLNYVWEFPIIFEKFPDSFNLAKSFALSSFQNSTLVFRK